MGDWCARCCCCRAAPEDEAAMAPLAQRLLPSDHAASAGRDSIVAEDENGHDPETGEADASAQSDGAVEEAEDKASKDAARVENRALTIAEEAMQQGNQCEMVANRRGMMLWEQRFLPPREQPRGVMLFLHGVHEHSARYDHVMEQLAQRLHLVVVSFDAQSHGKSEDVRGLRGACDAFEEFVDDAEDVLERLRGEFPGLPLFLWGQSFGGLVAAHVALREPDRISGLVLSSPAINIEWSLTLRVQGRAADMASKYTPDLAIVPAVDPEHMSKDPAAVEAYKNDPLNIVGPLRCRLGAETLKAFRNLERKRGSLTVKRMLVLFGDQDKCCSLSKAREFFADVPCPNKELKVFEGLYHTLFHEPEKEDVITKLADWVDAALQACSTSTATTA